MAPGEILIEVIIPIASVLVTALGIFVVKKRRDKKKLAKGKTVDLLQRIESLEKRMADVVDAYVTQTVSKQQIKKEIESASENLRVEIECVNSRIHDVPTKGEMERHVNDACKRMLGKINEVRSVVAACADKRTVEVMIEQAKTDMQNRIQEAVKRIAAETPDPGGDEEVGKQIVDSAVEIGSRCAVEWRKDINKKIQEYDLALTKWVKEQIKDLQLKPPTMKLVSEEIDIERDPDIDP